MTLVEALEKISTLDDGATIYATEPWSPLSRAIVAVEPPHGSVPLEASANGCTYFLEVAVASEVLDGLDRNRYRTNIQRCERVIEYAVRDA